ncbi:MAG: CDP-alcohol phosphatidyltransferase family protein [Candidatus Hodarchaeales archaeon]
MSYERFFAPYGRFLAKIGIKPDFISIIAISIACIAGILFAIRWFYLGVLLLIFSSLADMLDGSTARALGTDSPFGMVFDHTLDRYAEYFYFAGIMLSGTVDSNIVLLTIVGMFMASYIRAKAESAGRVKISGSGIFERKEKLTVVGFGAFFQGMYLDNLMGFTQIWDSILPVELCLGPLAIALIVVAFFSHVSAFQRLLYAKKLMVGKKTAKE